MTILLAKKLVGILVGDCRLLVRNAAIARTRQKETTKDDRAADAERAMHVGTANTARR